MGLFELLIEGLHLPFMQHALLLIFPLALVAGLIGVFINLRGLEFVSDGLTHAVFPGLAAGVVLAGNPGLLPGALVAALIATVALTVLGSRGVASDTATAITLTGMFGIGVLIVSSSASITTPIESLLFGHLFTLSVAEAGFSALACGIAALAVLVTFRAQVFSAFDTVGASSSGYHVFRTNLVLNSAIALVVVAASVAVGNLLVLSLLIVPGATARLVSTRFSRMVVVSVAVSVIASLTGVLLGFSASFMVEAPIPGGAAVALVFVIIYVVTLAVRLRR